MRKLYRLARSERMHGDGPNQISMSLETARFAGPLPIARLVLLSTRRTPAADSSLGAGEARQVSPFPFVRQILKIFAIFPQSQTLVLVPPVVVIAYPVRIANTKRSNLFLHTQAHDFSCRCVTHIPNALRSTTTWLVLGIRQFIPTFRVFGAMALLFCPFAALLMTWSFDGTNTAPGNNQRFPGLCRHCRKMDFSQVSRRMSSAGSLFSLRGFSPRLPFKAVLPHKEGYKPRLSPGIPGAGPMKDARPIGKTARFSSRLPACLGQCTGYTRFSFSGISSAFPGDAVVIAVLSQ